MQHIHPKNRNQIAFTSLEELIEIDNSVRFIDCFVDKLELNKLGFLVKTIKSEGRPSYQSSLFLKIYIYGYFNGIRSSRKLEKEAKRNIELQWLCSGLTPNYHSIADFRKDNPQALRNTFKLFVLFLKDADLISGTTIAIDGTKFRAHNSKKNNFNQKKIDRHLAYIEEKTNEYLQQLDSNDSQEDTLKIKQVQQKIERLKGNKLKYEVLQQQLETSGEPQISTSDADARALLVQGQVVEISYNTQAAVDDKYKLVVGTHTINRNDRNALSKIAIETKTNLEVETITAISDKGYHNGRELQQCKDNTITTICAHPEIVNSNAKGTTEAYLVTHFVYNKTEDTYTCPQGETLKTTGTWHKKTRERDAHQFKKYRTPACKTCPVKHLCTGREKGGREIDRSEFAEVVQQNTERYKANQQLYRTRQELNEHVFGTIKRVWGYYYTNLKGLKKVNGEWSLIMTVYNMKRSINILGFDKLMQKLAQWKPNYKKEWLFLQQTNPFKSCITNYFFETKLAA